MEHFVCGIRRSFNSKMQMYYKKLVSNVHQAPDCFKLQQVSKILEHPLAMLLFLAAESKVLLNKLLL